MKIVDCKHYNQGYCYFKDISTTKEVCKNMCEHFSKDEVEECIGCDKNKENMCADCCRDWDNEEEDLTNE
ncbi:hypothetical protein [Clostridium botulinum]|uniref:hypothetical protein n=1 Tax=Clostridium botulinum TaxID=1491 RepID=UPI0002EB8FFD|nr:hypothetical protein [Clostridium botulinum]KEI01584.1 hypothetical protein Z952_12100 [Clostridium botulinum C/D str. BKT75002]KEI07918.1 hypothetical protein Z954_03235 [Clostridium botulinum C/D str. BKT2873]KLU74231.1 hypothetical protein CBC3_p0229 [Clostridium botulinum V891]QPW61555.1 hypothetical protein IG390_05160 [Clostridium botulinum]